MPLRRLWFLFLASAPLLGGCGVVSGVRTAFEMPVVPTPSPQERARARQTHAFDSLSQSLAKLDSKTLGRYFSSGQKGSSKPGAPAVPQPVGLSAQPARALANDLARGASVPVAPRQIAVSLPQAGVTPSLPLPSTSGAATHVLGTRVVRTSPSSASGSNTALNEFLRAWASRSSLRRSDDELLRQRALEDRVNLQTRSARPTLDLSLVSPETQLELTNLRLKLVPLLSIPVAQRLQAKQQIEAIEARLNQIWEEETARQSALLHQALVDAPARLRQEGDKVIELNTRLDSAKTQARLAQVRAKAQARAGTVALPALGLVQRPALAPDVTGVRATLGVSVVASRGASAPLRPLPLPVEMATEKRGAGSAARSAQNLAERGDQIWRAATR